VPRVEPISAAPTRADAVDRVRVARIPNAWSVSPEDLVRAAIVLAAPDADRRTGSTRPMHEG